MGKNGTTIKCSVKLSRIALRLPASPIGRFGDIKVEARCRFQRNLNEGEREKGGGGRRRIRRLTNFMFLIPRAERAKSLIASVNLVATGACRIESSRRILKLAIWNGRQKPDKNYNKYKLSKLRIRVWYQTATLARRVCFREMRPQGDGNAGGADGGGRVMQGRASPPRRVPVAIPRAGRGGGIARHLNSLAWHGSRGCGTSQTPPLSFSSSSSSPARVRVGVAPWRGREHVIYAREWSRAWKTRAEKEIGADAPCEKSYRNKRWARHHRLEKPSFPGRGRKPVTGKRRGA